MSHDGQTVDQAAQGIQQPINLADFRQIAGEVTIGKTYILGRIPFRLVTVDPLKRRISLRCLNEAEVKEYNAWLDRQREIQESMKQFEQEPDKLELARRFATSFDLLKRIIAAEDGGTQDRDVEQIIEEIRQFIAN